VHFLFSPRNPHIGGNKSRKRMNATRIRNDVHPVACLTTCSNKHFKMAKGYTLWWNQEPLTVQLVQGDGTLRATQSMTDGQDEETFLPLQTDSLNREIGAATMKDGEIDFTVSQRGHDIVVAIFLNSPCLPASCRITPHLSHPARSDAHRVRPGEQVTFLVRLSPLIGERIHRKRGPRE